MSDKIDPAMRAAYASLPDSLKSALLDGDPSAEAELRDAYLAEKSRQPVPNRSARRAGQRAQRKASR